MNPKFTWIWISVAAVLFGLIVLSHQLTTTVVVGPQPVLPDFKAGTTTSIQVTPAAVPAIMAERTNLTWQLVKPVVYPAQKVGITNLLTALEGLTVATHIHAAEMRQRPNADAEFGFATPQFQLTVQNRDVQWRIKVGAMTAPGDQVYVQVEGREGAYVVDAGWLRLLPRQADDWRDLAWIDVRALPVDRVTISNNPVPFELQRPATDGPWSLARPFAARADNERFNLLLDNLRAVRVARFITDDPKADLSSFGLQPPEMQIELAQGSNRLARLEFGRKVSTNEALIYARRSDWNSVVAVPKEMLGAWYEPLDNFRDHRLLALPGLIDQIELRGGNPFTLQRQPDGSWKINGETLPVDAYWVGEFINWVSTLQISQFKDAATPADLQQFGLTASPRQIIFRSAITNVAGVTNLVRAELSFGATNGNLVYVRRADEKPVYQVALADVQHLPTAAWQFREQRIWNFDAADVQRVTIRQNGKVREFAHFEKNNWKVVQGVNVVINNFAVEEAVTRFGALIANNWVERDAKNLAPYGIGPSGCSLTFSLESGEKREIQIGIPQDGRTAYGAVTLDGQVWVFELRPQLFQPVKDLQIPANAP